MASGWPDKHANLRMGCKGSPDGSVAVWTISASVAQTRQNKIQSKPNKKPHHHNHLPPPSQTPHRSSRVLQLSSLVVVPLLHARRTPCHPRLLLLMPCGHSRSVPVWVPLRSGFEVAFVGPAVAEESTIRRAVASVGDYEEKLLRYLKEGVEVEVVAMLQTEVLWLRSTKVVEAEGEAVHLRRRMQTTGQSGY
ncbi:hypothetical protein BC835DRAFT_1040047 [Cytidiella melzeri]|nr:hypothetical protein BC835DRAFT_1040047 [Cytidiella melzeri]